MNIYGPYSGRLENSVGFFGMGWMYQGLAIVAGGVVDFSLRAAEIWGDPAEIDCLSDYFKTKLEVGKWGCLTLSPLSSLPLGGYRI